MIALSTWHKTNPTFGSRAGLLRSRAGSFFNVSHYIIRHETVCATALFNQYILYHQATVWPALIRYLLCALSLQKEVYHNSNYGVEWNYYRQNYKPPDNEWAFFETVTTFKYDRQEYCITLHHSRESVSDDDML